MTGARARPLARWPFWYAAAFALLTCWYLLRCPILPADTDLWFHLDAGRYLFQHQALPHDTYYSFLSPPRPWVDYAWLFQALVYAVYAISGYLGLVLFRAAVFGVTLWLIFRYLRRSPTASSASGWVAAVFTLATLILLPRDLLIRPHLFSYLFLVLLLFGLEYRPRWTAALPLLAMLWGNLHGIAYPFVWLIVGAYVAEDVLKRIRGRAAPSPAAGTLLVPAALAMAAVLVTPHGVSLLSLPWQSLGEVTEFTSELQPLVLLSPLGLNVLTLFRISLLLGGVAVVLSLMKQRSRLSHLLLVAGGLFLLTKGSRFMVECVLLSLPVLAANPLSVRLPVAAWKAPLVAGLSGMLMIMPVHFLGALFRNTPRFPVAGETLPEGAVAFLKEIDIGGRLLSSLNPAGYLRWTLSPRYTIFMDMEFPHPFNEEDFRLGRNVLQHPELLKWVVSRYDPAGLVVPIGLASFKGTIKELPEFAMVFFDDTSVLYLNRGQHPEIVSRYEITDVDPYALVSQDTEKTLETSDHEQLMKRLAAILSIHPRCGIAHYLAAMVYRADQAYDRMIPHAQAMMRDFPSSPEGYQVMEEALRGLQAAEEAMRYRRLALARAQ